MEQVAAATRVAEQTVADLAAARGDVGAIEIIAHKTDLLVAVVGSSEIRC
jgi:hypothetical protein